MQQDEPTLARLMAAAQTGDRAAYRTLLTEVKRWLEQYFRRRVAPQQLDDLVQEVMLAMHNKRATWDTSRAFLPWLAAIARYRWLDHLRGVYRSQEQSMEDADFVAPGEEDALHARLSLDRLLVQLPDKQRSVIDLVKICGLSITEAAARTGQSESLVKINIHRGLKRLTSLVEKAN
ncbi:sigma-70 family RNA polymerase sigma factor [Halopseudomonas sp.]|jgi:RNA polymerase sigma-70 factor (ECF subfamily)|uniref:sigma-70 family RNA polymerase sigma factor n=1 Tax=Halopseudomonas sp. TaxID=2901191 RepID=UPI00300300FE